MTFYLFFAIMIRRAGGFYRSKWSCLLYSFDWKSTIALCIGARFSGDVSLCALCKILCL